MEVNERAGRNEWKKTRWGGRRKTGTMRRGKSNCREQKKEGLKKRVAEKTCREGERQHKRGRECMEMEAAA